MWNTAVGHDEKLTNENDEVNKWWTTTSLMIALYVYGQLVAIIFTNSETNNEQTSVRKEEEQNLSSISKLSYTVYLNS